MAKLILHVDDDPQMPEGVVSILEADGYEWVQTADPERVMQLVQDREPALVLMEIDLSGCDGLDLLAGILSVCDEVPVLILTRAPRDSSLHGEAIALGVTNFLCKPALRAQLLSSIREIAAPAAPPPAAAAAAAPAPAPGDLSGEIAESPVPELLARLRRRGSAGVVRLRRGDTVVGIQLRNGTPIYVGTNRGSGASEALEDEDAAEAMLFETFAWTDGSWEFFAGRRLPADATCELSRDPDGLLVRGVMQACSEARALDRLRKRSTLYVSVSATWGEPLEGVELTSRQVGVLDDMNGQESLGDLLDSMVFEERALYALWVAGRIDLHAVPTLDLTDAYGEESPASLELELEVEAGPAPQQAPARPEPRREHRVEHVRVEPRPARRVERARPTSVQGPAARGSRPATAEIAPDDISDTLRALAQQMTSGDDFQVLGVPVDVSDDRVREAYRRRLDEIPKQALDGSDLALRVRAERIRDRIESAYAHLKDPESRRAYALLRAEESQERKAVSEAERALEGERWFRKGRGHLDQRRYDEAAEAFGMASHLDPKEGEYLAHLGYALFLSKPGNKVVQREATEHVANGIKRSPTREMSYIYLGRILKSRGETDAAVKLFRRALRVKPDSHPALQELRLLEMRRRKEKGKGILSRILGE